MIRRPAIATCWIGGLVVCTVMLLTAKTSAADQQRQRGSQQVESDGFCALESAKACAERLGVRWAKTPETLQLESLPIASLAQIKRAFESLGLNTKTLRLDNRNIRQVQREIGVDVEAIGWLSADEVKLYSQIDVGHFALFNEIQSDNELTLIDANGVDIYLKTLERGESLPLLLVSPNSLDPGIYTLSLHFASVVLSSPWTIGALLLSTLFCCLENAPKPRWVKRGAASGVAVVFLSAFLVIETNLVNGFSVFADADHDRPLRFGQFEFDFGTVLKERLEPRVIRLKNYSDTPIEIKEIRRNCGCLTPTPEKTDIAAGEEIEIDISFSTIVEGPNSYVIEVIGSEGNSAKCRIVFDGRSNIELVPSKHMLGAISRADDAEAVFDVEVQLAYVYDRIIRSIEVGEISSDQPLDCSVGKLFGDSNQHALLKVSVNPDVTRTGFVFQEIPMVVDLGTEQVHLSFEVGADFVE